MAPHTVKETAIGAGAGLYLRALPSRLSRISAPSRSPRGRPGAHRAASPSGRPGRSRGPSRLGSAVVDADLPPAELQLSADHGQWLAELVNDHPEEVALAGRDGRRRGSGFRRPSAVGSLWGPGNVDEQRHMRSPKATGSRSIVLGCRPSGHRRAWAVRRLGPADPSRRAECRATFRATLPHVSGERAVGLWREARGTRA